MTDCRNLQTVCVYAICSTNVLVCVQVPSMKSYLNDRQFETTFNGEISSRFHIHSGVPQWSILGPLLYVLCTSDLPTFRETTLDTFADDTAIFATHEDPTIASLNFQSTYT